MNQNIGLNITFEHNCKVSLLSSRMKNNLNLKFLAIIIFVSSIIPNALHSDNQANNTSNDFILKNSKAELFRNMEELKKQSLPPYFISYNITDSKKTSISASFGTLRNSSSNDSRILDIDLRVGSYKFDNTHIIRGNPFNFSGGGGNITLPLDNNELALKNALWLATDRVYKSAVERYEKALTNQKVKVKEEDLSNDMSEEKASIYYSQEQAFVVDTKKWEEVCRKLSAKFLDQEFLYDAEVSFQAENLTKYFVNSEGSELRWDESYARVFVYAKTKAEDGMSLPLYESYFSYNPDGLPNISKIESDIDSMIVLLKNLKTAPLMTTTSVPAILSGEAAGVFFHEIFGHRVEGHREKDPNSSQTFKNAIDTKILPDFIDVIFDPTISKIRNSEISGHYDYDDEGVKAEKVVSVEKGVFKRFLMSRSPIEKFPTSNGHGRKQAGYKAVTRQSNLIVQSSKTVSKEELKNMLRQECKKQNKEFGLYFQTVQGGFTFTGRTVPNAFNVQPLVVYKVYADGRPDELVRGVDLIGTPLTTFNNIVATADDLGVFNGVCGAESGGVPVSAVAPTMLVSTIEIQKKKKSQAKLPVLPSPVKKLTN